LRPERELTAYLWLVALALLSGSRVYMLRDAYADDNVWLLAMYVSDSLGEFLATGFVELRRVPQGLFVYLHLLPYRYLEDPFVVWHTMALAVQVATPLVLYRLVRGLGGDSWLAVFVASAMIIVPLDHVLPYVCTLNYKLAGLLALGSLYLTDAAAREGRWGWRLPLAALLAGIAAHLLAEVAIGLEPARLLLLLNRFRRPQRPLGETLVPVLKWLAPFALLAAALVAYKLALKPYGVYAGMYATGLSHFLDLDAILQVIRLFALGLWRVLRRAASYTQPETAVIAIIVAAVALYLLFRLRADRLRGVRSPHGFLALLGIAIIAPQLFIFFYAGRVPKLGTDSTHAALMQPGYAMLLGALAHWTAVRVLSRRASFVAAAAALAALAGTGVYFSNLNLDLFKAASLRQEDFWHAFKRRFPALPENADFVIDAVPPPYGQRVETFFYFEDLRTYYELELALNRLYAPQAPTGERRHRAYPAADLSARVRAEGPALLSGKLVRRTHFGSDTLDASQMTYVYWRGGELLVNREIVEADSSVLYRTAASKAPPAWAAPRSDK
jgi:hypothetical protein